MFFCAQKTVHMKIPLKTNTYDINGLSFGALVAFIKGVRGQGVLGPGVGCKGQSKGWGS